MRDTLYGLGQLVGALAVAGGVYLLLGLAWSLVIVGTGVLVLSTIAEALPARLAPAPRPRPDPALTELPGAPRSRPNTKG